MVRRASAVGPDVADIETAAFRLDLAGRRAFAGPDRHEVRLTPTEWSIAVQLARQPDRLLTHKQLVLAVWGPGYDPDPNLLRVHMGHIRRKLEPDPAHPRYFITDSGMGTATSPRPRRRTEAGVRQVVPSPAPSRPPIATAARRWASVTPTAGRGTHRRYPSDRPRWRTAIATPSVGSSKPSAR